MGVYPLPPGPSRDLPSRSSPPVSPPRPPFLPASEFLGVPVGGSAPVHPAPCPAPHFLTFLPALRAPSQPSLPLHGPQSKRTRHPPGSALAQHRPTLRPGLGLPPFPGERALQSAAWAGAAGTSEGRGPGLEPGGPALRAGDTPHAHGAGGWVGVGASGRSGLRSLAQMVPGEQVGTACWAGGSPAGPGPRVGELCARPLPAGSLHVPAWPGQQGGLRGAAMAVQVVSDALVRAWPSSRPQGLQRPFRGLHGGGLPQTPCGAHHSPSCRGERGAPGWGQDHGDYKPLPGSSGL